MEGETFFVAFFKFFFSPQKRDRRLVLGTNPSWSSAVVSQRSKTWKGAGGNRSQDTGSNYFLERWSRKLWVRQVTRNWNNRKVKQEAGVFGGGEGKKGDICVNQPCLERAKITDEGPSKGSGTARTNVEKSLGTASVRRFASFERLCVAVIWQISWQGILWTTDCSRTEPTCS